MNNTEVKSKSKRNEILAAARTLYYNRGMDEVSFDEISKECSITKSLIRYHFESKANLANELFGKYSKEHANILFQKAYALGKKYSVYEMSVAFSLLCVKYYKEDQNSLRFFIQLFSCTFALETSGIEDFYKMAGFGPLNKMDKDVLHMKYIGGQYAARGLIYHYAIGNIQCSEEEFEHYYIKLEMMDIMPEEKINRLIERAHELIDEVNIRFLPNFIWE